jgi:hypothetical protein
MKKIFIYFITCFFFLLIINTVSAWGPHTHNYIVDKIKERSVEINNITFCFDNSVNEQAFRGGMMLPDITIVDYIGKHKNYQVTHSWNFQREVLNRAETQDEKCLAYGIASHLIADSVAHGKFIPSKIKETGFSEGITHPIMEEKYDECLAFRNKNLIEETGKSLDIFYSKTKGEYIEKIQATLGKETGLNVQKNINGLSSILKALKAVIIADRITIFLNPSKFCNETEINDYMQQAEDLIIDNFNR